MSLSEAFEKAHKKTSITKIQDGIDKEISESKLENARRYGLDNEKIMEIQKSIESRKDRLEMNDIPIPEKYRDKEKVGILNRIFSALTFTETASYANAIQRDYSLLDTVKTKLDRTWTEVVKGEEYEYDTSIAEDIDTATYSDVLEDAGWQPEGTTEKFMRSAVGLGVDIVADPLSYLSFASLGKAKKVLIPGKGAVNLTDEGAKVLQNAIDSFGEFAGKRAMATAIEETGDKFIQKRALVRAGGLFDEGEELISMDIIKKPAKFIDDSLSSLNHGGGIYRGVKGFLNKTKDAVMKPFDYWSELRNSPIRDEVEMLEKAIVRKAKADMNRASMQIYNKAEKILKEQGHDFAEDLSYMVERGEKVTGVQSIDNMLSYITENNIAKRTDLTEAGYEIGEIPNYVKRQLGDYGKRFFDEIENKEASNAFVKTMRSIFKTGKASGQKKRKLNRLVTEAGEDVSFKRAGLGLKKIDTEDVINKFEDDAQKTISVLEDKMEKLMNKELADENTTLKQLLDSAKDAVDNNNFGGVYEITGEISDENAENALKYLTKIEQRNLEDSLQALRSRIVTSYGDEYLSKPLREITDLSKDQKVSKLYNEILETQNKLAEKMRKFQFYDYVDKDGNFYKEVLEETDVAGKTFQPLTIREINEEMRRVGKEYGLDVSDEDQFFNENIFQNMIAQESEYHRQLKGAQFVKEMDKRFAFSKDQLTDSLQREAEDNLARFGEEFFRKDGMKYVKADIKMFGEKFMEDKFIPEQLKEHIQKSNSFFTGDNKSVNKLLSFYDKALSLFKKNVTGYFPAFHTRNFLGGTFNNFLAGVKDPRMYGKTGKILKYKKAIDRGEDVADEVMELGGKKFKLSKLVKEFDKHNLFNQPGMMDVIRDFDDTAKAIGNQHGAKRVLSEMSEAPRKGFEFVENQVRIPLFLDRVAKGDSFDQAAQSVYKHHFDYAPEFLTGTEKNVIKRIIPFYTWTKNNIPLQIENVVKQPGKYSLTNKLRREIDAVSGKEKVRVERENMPDWMKDMFTIRLPNVKDSGEPYYLQLDLPMTDLNRMNTTDIANMMSPLLKYPAERYFNKDFFFGNELYDESLPRQYQTKETIGALKNLPEPVKDFIGIREVKGKNFFTGEFEDRVVMDSRNLHALQSLFFSRFYSTADDLFDTEASTAEKITKLAAGTPLRPLDIDKQKWYRLKSKDYQLGQYINHLLQRKTIPYADEDKEDFIQGTSIPKENFIKGLGDAMFRRGD